MLRFTLICPQGLPSSQPSGAGCYWPPFLKASFDYGGKKITLNVTNESHRQHGRVALICFPGRNTIQLFQNLAGFLHSQVGGLLNALSLYHSKRTLCSSETLRCLLCWIGHRSSLPLSRIRENQIYCLIALIFYGFLTDLKTISVCNLHISIATANCCFQEGSANKTKPISCRREMADRGISFPCASLTYCYYRFRKEVCEKCAKTNTKITGPDLCLVIPRTGN